MRVVPDRVSTLRQYLEALVRVSKRTVASRSISTRTSPLIAPGARDLRVFEADLRAR